MPRILTSFAAASLLLVAPSAFAQARPERPYRGLFGGNDTESQQGLTVSGSLGGGYDSDLWSDADSAFLPNADFGDRSGGTLGQFSGTLSYSLSGAGANLSAHASTAGRYYPSANGDTLHRRESAAVRGTTPIGAGFSLDAGATYSPFRVWDLYSTPIPDRGEASDAFDFGSSSAHHVAYSGALDGGWQLSRRLRVGTGYEYRSRAGSVDVPGYGSHSADGNMRYNLGRGLDLKLGYSYTEGRYSGGEKYVRHGINAGVDFSRALSFSRRTTLSFSTGTAAAGNPSLEGLRYHAVGDVTLTHEIGRSWAASVSYSRNLRISEYWPQPIFSDYAGVSLGGLLNRRLQIHSRAAVSSGRLPNQESSGFDTYFADAGMTFSVSRQIGFGASYRYYHHQFSEAFRLVPGMPSIMDRHSVHVYLTAWAPIFQRARRP